MSSEEWMLADLRKSGLTDETIREMGVYPCPAGHEGTEKLKSVLGFASIEGQGILQASNAYFFPYPGEGEFCRVKLENPIPGKDGKPAKYLSPAKSQGKVPYLLERDRAKLKESRFVWLTEGEKKAALLSQELSPMPDHAAVGFPGVWMFPAFSESQGKTFLVVFDSDFREKRGVQLAIAALCFEILSAKGIPRLVSWDPAKGKGIDDYLLCQKDRMGELRRLSESAAENPFASLAMLQGDDLSKQASKTKGTKPIIESWFERYSFRTLFRVTKSGFSALIKSARQEAAMSEILSKSGGKIDWVDFDDKGKPYIVPGSCALDFYRRQDGNLIYAQESFWRWGGKAWELAPDVAVKAQIQDMVVSCVVRASRKLAVEDVFFQVRNWAFREGLEFDADKSRIVMENGVLDLDAMTLSAHCREHHQTILLPYGYDPGAQCPRFRRFLEEIFPVSLYANSASVVARLQEWAGYCLVPTAKLERCLYLWGEGANGKSVLLKTLAAMVGERNACALEPKSLFERFQLVGLRGKLVNICTDIDTKTVFSEEFKKIVSGEPCTVDIKFKDHAKFSPFARHLFSANALVATKDRSYGFFRRFDVIEFKQRFGDSEKDESLYDRLLGELPGIFNWALEGLRRLRAHDWKFSASPDFDRTKERFEMESNPVAMFVSECCENLQDSLEERQIPYQEWTKYLSEKSASAKAVRERYARFCLENGYSPLSDVHFGKEMARLGYALAQRRLKNGQRERYYQNLGIS